MLKKISVNLTLLLLLIFPQLALAQDDFTFDNSSSNEHPKKVVTLSKDQVVDKDYFAAGDVVEVSGTVNGDVYVAGGQILIDGTVNGDVLAAGGTISISGKVSQNVRVAGGQINISGEVGRNLTVGAGNLEISKDALLSGSVVIGAGNANISAPVAKDIKAGAGNLVLGNTVGGDIEAGVGELRLASDAQVDGKLTYWSNKSATISQDATVSGQIKHNLTPEVKGPNPKDFAKALISIAVFFKFISLVSSLIVGLLLIFLVPIFTQTVSENITKNPWSSLGWGIFLLIFIPIFAFALFVSIIGIPIAIILLLLYFASLFIARIYAIFWIGDFVVKRMDRKVGMGWTYIGGLVTYYLVTFIPGIGDLIGLFVLLFGLGAAMLTKRELYLSFRKKNLI